MDYNTIMSLFYYDLENIMESYANILEDRNKEDAKRAKEQGIDYTNTNPKDMLNSTAKSIMPKMPNFNLPKF